MLSCNLTEVIIYGNNSNKDIIGFILKRVDLKYLFAFLVIAVSIDRIQSNTD